MRGRGEVPAAVPTGLAAKLPPLAAPELDPASALSCGLALLDGLRARLLRFGVRALGGGGRALIRKPALRVAVFGSLSVGLALLLTCTMPLLLLAVSPLLLGVPHLLADVRYLVLQPGYHRRLRLALPVAAVLLGAAVGLGMRAGLLAMAVTLVLAGARPQDSPARSLLRRGLGLGLVAGLAYLGYRSDFYWLDLGMAHGHNFIAVLIAVLWLRRRPLTGAPAWSLWLPLVLFGAAAVLLGTGGLTASATALGRFDDHPQLGLDGARWLLAPYLPVDWGTRVVLLFAFAQAVHYGVWLRLLPDVARERDTPRSFTASLSALRAQLSPTLLGLFGLVFIALLLFALLDLAGARERYFRIAMFHGHLELCALALVWVEGLPTLSPLPLPSPSR